MAGGCLSTCVTTLNVLCAHSACVYSLDVLTDLPFQAVPSLLQLFDGAVLWELIRSTSHLALRHAACEQLLVQRRLYHLWCHKIGNHVEIYAYSATWETLRLMQSTSLTSVPSNKTIKIMLLVHDSKSSAH